MTFNLATILRESARRSPDKTLMHFADQSFSYAQVDEISGRVASALLLAAGLPALVDADVAEVPPWSVQAARAMGAASAAAASNGRRRRCPRPRRPARRTGPCMTER